MANNSDATASSPLGADYLLLTGSTDSKVIWAPSLVLSPDSSALVVFGNSGFVLFETATWTQLREETRPTKWAAFSTDSKRLLVVSAEPIEVVEVFDTEAHSQSTPNKIYFSGLSSEINCVACSSGDLVATALENGDVCLQMLPRPPNASNYDSEDPKQTTMPARLLRGHKQGVVCVAFSPNGMLLASGSRERGCNIRIWDVEAIAVTAATASAAESAPANCIRLLDGHPSPIDLLSFSPNGSWLASYSFYGDGIIYFWDASSGHSKMSRRWQAPVKNAKFLSWSPNSQYLATGNKNQIQLFSIAAGLQSKSRRKIAGSSIHSDNVRPDDDHDPDGPTCVVQVSVEACGLAFGSSNNGEIMTVTERGLVNRWTSLVNTIMSGTDSADFEFQSDMLRSLVSCIPQPAFTVQEELDRLVVIIERMDLPTVFHEQLALLGRVCDPALGDVIKRVDAENEIANKLSSIIQQSRSLGPTATKSALARLQESISSIMRDIEYMNTKHDHANPPTAPTAEINAATAQGVSEYSDHGTICASDLPNMLDFAHKRGVRLVSLTKGILQRSNSLLQALHEFDLHALKMNDEMEANSRDIEDLVLYLKQRTDKMSIALNALGSSETFDFSAANTNSGAASGDTHVLKSSTANNAKPMDGNTASPDSMKMDQVQQIRLEGFSPSCLAICPSTGNIAVATENGIFVLHGLTGESMWGSSIPSVSVAFSWRNDSNESFLASCDLDRVIRIYQASSGHLIQTCLAGGLQHFIFWSVDDSILTVSKSGKTLVWHQDPSFPAKELQKEGYDIVCAALSPNGKLVATGCVMHLQIWDVTLGEVLWEQQGFERRVQSLAFNADGTKLAANHSGTVITVWDTINYKLLWSLQVPGVMMNCMSWSPNSRYIAAAQPSCVRIFTLEDGKQDDCPCQKYDIEAQVLSFSADGGEIITVDSNGKVCVWISPVESLVLMASSPSRKAATGKQHAPLMERHVWTMPDIEQVPDILDRVQAHFARVNHPIKFYEILCLLHRAGNALQNYEDSNGVSAASSKTNRVDTSASSSSSSSYSLSMQHPLGASDKKYERMFNYVHQHGLKLSELERNVLAKSRDFCNALVTFDFYSADIQSISAKNVTALNEYLGTLERPAWTSAKLDHIMSVVANIQEDLRRSEKIQSWT